MSGMTASDWLRVKAMIAQAMDVILSGNTADTQVDGVVGTESIDNLYPGTTTIEGRPVAHPFGLVSRAPTGTAQVTARQGDHPGNRLVLLHRDKNRPSLANEGEVMIYDAFGNKIYLKNGEIQIGDGATKKAARATDPVKVTLAAGLAAVPSSVAGLAAILAPAITSPAGPCVPTVGYTAPASYDINGDITDGSGTVKIVD